MHTTAVTDRGRTEKRDWRALRAEYVAGNESFAQMARRIGVSTGRIEKHALNRRANDGKTWAELRAAFRDRVTANALELAGAVLAQKRREFDEGAMDIALDALKILQRRVDEDAASLRAADLIAIVRLGLTASVEIGMAVDSARPGIWGRLDELTVGELRALARPVRAC